MTGDPYIMHVDHTHIVPFSFYRLTFKYKSGEEEDLKGQWNTLERSESKAFHSVTLQRPKQSGFFFFFLLPPPSPHCSHMAHTIIKLNMKPMSHEREAQIIREVTSISTAAPLKRLCQLSAQRWENKSWNIMHSDVWHMIAGWSIFPSRPWYCTLFSEP